VDAEITADCNMNCPMCYRSQLPKDSIGYMSFETFRTIVDECADNGLYSLRLSWRGEPLIHKDVIRMIEYAKKRGIKNVSFLTNGLLLQGDMAESVIEAGLTYLSVSFDGVGKVYDRIRHPAKFEEAYKRLLDFKELKRKKGSGTPLVRVNTVWPAVAQNPGEYKSVMSKATDMITFNPFIDFFSNAGKPAENFVCQYPWQRISITCMGKIMPCTGVSVNEGYELGRIGETSIKDAWHSDKMQELRERHKELQRMDIPCCAECRHGIEKKDIYTTEGFKLDGEKMWIE
jgi:MoaA/NifB/PqqE/SkfB family radical SAM enzyme